MSYLWETIMRRIRDFKNLKISPITREQCSYFILHIHYAKRFPSISFAFGMFSENTLIGIITYGSPASYPLRKGIAGDFYTQDIIELNRLCLLHNRKNEATC